MNVQSLCAVIDGSLWIISSRIHQAESKNKLELNYNRLKDVESANSKQKRNMFKAFWSVTECTYAFIQHKQKKVFKQSRQEHDR